MGRDDVGTLRTLRDPSGLASFQGAGLDEKSARGRSRWAARARGISRAEDIGRRKGAIMLRARPASIVWKARSVIVFESLGLEARL